MPSSSSTMQSIGKWMGNNILYSEALASDQRVPSITFSIAGSRYGLLAPSLQFWLALGTCLLLGAIYSTILSCIMYQFIILPRKKKKKHDHDASSSTTTSLLVGFGFIVPLCVIYPYYGIHFFLIKNKVIKFLFGIASLTTAFRCSEAIFGFLPLHVENSLWNVIVYNAFPVECKFDKQGAIKSTWANVCSYIRNFGASCCVLGMYCSLLVLYDYKLYPTEEGPELRDVSLYNALNWHQLANNFSIAILFQMYLTTFSYAINAVTSLFGLVQIPMMLNPIFESTSLSDFWGRRWNLVVHGFLKRGVYKPVRTKYSRLAAATAAFLASGFFHEWLLSVTLYPDYDSIGECTPPSCFRPGYGRNTLFFVWNAALIGIEYAVSGAAVFKLLKTHLPLTIISLLVTCTALPVAHWFTNDYVRTDFFHDGQLGWPIIVRLDE
eukprot:CAMPEP_0201687430 /NCGR_PEP_ID=MMETSP0578-20130828/1500_1 /ASSEMBLY_ACC=CAM_ASM_000663 /TAXON_ID=267565 /ORGANISM="Skeletonema grethea, Strain CCMP 1804" /LENGTH=436 /DNA_ID=CAMNT_0048171587 /DNA_START=55 /DNA_END=1365 /DNA_ORIENTATION=+